MCLDLTVKQLKGKIATKNIVVYKSGSFRELNTKFHPCQRSFIYHVGKITNSNLDTPTRSNKMINFGLHSYKNKRGCNAKCIIPIGATYYEGKHNGCDLGYASSHLIIVGELKSYKI